MKKVKFIILIILLFILNIRVVSAKCNNSYLSELRGISSNVNFSYDYYIENGDAIFNLIINNLTPNMYIINNDSNERYNYENTTNGELTIYGLKNLSSISFSMYAVGEGCDNKKLLTKYIKLPSYNQYYENEICKGIEEFQLCNKWLKQEISYNTFTEQVKKYKQSLESKTDGDDSEITIKDDLIDKIVKYYSKYYYVILIIIIVICAIIILYQNKKNRFKI